MWPVITKARVVDTRREVIVVDLQPLAYYLEQASMINVEPKRISLALSLLMANNAIVESNISMLFILQTTQRSHLLA